MKAAGFTLTGLIGGHEGEMFTLPEATPEYLEGLKDRIAARGLTANVTALRFEHGARPEDSMPDVRRQIDNAARLGLPSIMTFGVHNPAHFESFYSLMALAAPYAADKGLQLVTKPHGGVTATGRDMLRCIERVNHPNFRIWYDAGNIIHYTSRDPVEELAPIAEYVTGFCAKDCAQEKGDVMIAFGTGKVDFRAVFRAMKQAGFAGPVMIECCRPGTPPELIENTRANAEFLRRAFDEG